MQWLILWCPHRRTHHVYNGWPNSSENSSLEEFELSVALLHPNTRCRRVTLRSFVFSLSELVTRPTSDYPISFAVSSFALFAFFISRHAPPWERLLRCAKKTDFQVQFRVRCRATRPTSGLHEEVKQKRNSPLTVAPAQKNEGATRWTTTIRSTPKQWCKNEQWWVPGNGLQ